MEDEKTILKSAQTVIKLFERKPEAKQVSDKKTSSTAKQAKDSGT